MKSELLRYLATIGLLFAVAAVVHAEETKATPKHKLATDFETCPSGHKELKDVPIVWGHFELFGKHPRDYT